MQDAALARAIAEAGAAIDARAEAELCRRFAPRVRLYGLRHLRDPHAACDLVQHVLMTTLERLRAGKLREPGRVASFVLGMCRQVVIDWRRGVRRREALLETWGERDAAVAAPEPLVLDRARLAACLERLSARERSVVVASFFDERSTAESAAGLGLAPGNVRVIRHRALARLRECMQGAKAS